MLLGATGIVCYHRPSFQSFELFCILVISVSLLVPFEGRTKFVDSDL